MPHDVILGIAVQEEQRRSGTANEHVDLRAGGPDGSLFKAVKHASSLPEPPRAQTTNKSTILSGLCDLGGSGVSGSSLHASGANMEARVGSPAWCECCDTSEQPSGD